MAKYRKADNCGRVPHPDRSGKFLEEGDVAEGDDWEPFVALGFVVRIDEEPASIEVVAPLEVAPAPVDVESEAPAPVEAPVEVPAQVEVDAPAPVEAKIDEPKAAILTEDPKGVSDVQQANVGSGAEEVDPSEAGKPSDEGLSGRTSTRRRR